jgi:large subunit ribosomal protein L19
MNLIDVIEKENVKDSVPEFSIGDTVKVYYKIKEGNKERVQGYEGTVIARRHGSVRENFTVRHISFGVGVERTFPLHSPKIDKIEVLKRGKVRRAKLFYLRDLAGKATKIREQR